MVSVKVSFMLASVSPPLNERRCLLLLRLLLPSSQHCPGSWLNPVKLTISRPCALLFPRNLITGIIVLVAQIRNLFSAPPLPLKFTSGARTRTGVNLKVFKGPSVSLTHAPQRDKRRIFGSRLSLDTSYQSWWLRLMISVSAETQRQNHFIRPLNSASIPRQPNVLTHTPLSFYEQKHSLGI